MNSDSVNYRRMEGGTEHDISFSFFSLSLSLFVTVVVLLNHKTAIILAVDGGGSTAS